MKSNTAVADEKKRIFISMAFILIRDLLLEYSKQDVKRMWEYYKVYN
jgi:hypothetical protein